MASAVAVTIVSTVATAAVTAAFSAVAPTLAGLGSWDETRESFTQQSVKAMWDARPGDYAAAICYNMGYSVSNTAQMYEKTSLQLKQGLLHTDYDCFYISGPDNKFTSEGDGGYINLATYYDTSRCTFDDQSDLYCTS